MVKNEYKGKYRARVVDIKDPEKRGRIRVICPSVLGESKSPWCETCIPVAYDDGGDFCLPKVGEYVWVEFEEGDSNKPILTGCWWSQEKVPEHIPVDSYDEDASKYRTIEFCGTSIIMVNEDKEVPLKSCPQITLIKDKKVEVNLGDPKMTMIKDERVEIVLGSSKIEILPNEMTITAGGATILLKGGNIYLN